MDSSEKGFFGGLGAYLKSLQVADRRILVSIMFLLAFGLIFIYSISSSLSRYGVSQFRKQLIFVVLGIVVMIFVSFVDYHLAAKLGALLYVAAFALIGATKIGRFAEESHGATRWLNIYGFRIQPAELMKPAIVLFVAYLLTIMGRTAEKIRAMVLIGIIAGVPALAIIKITSNLSTAIIVAGIAAIMYFIAYPNRKIWLIAAFCVLAAVVFAYWYYNSKLIPALDMDPSLIDYRTMRVLSWIYPDAYPTESQQTRYSMYSIGFGGLLGRGLGSGTMKYYLPEPMNDFIFAVIAEEIGFIGCGIIMFLFCYLIHRIVVVSKHSKDKLGGFIASGMAAHLALQVIFHIGVDTGVLPNTGISLPFISYGGSALLVQMAEMGILLNVSRQIPGKRIPAAEGMGANAVSSGKRQRKTA